MQVNSQSNPKWWKQLFSGISQEFRMRKMLAPALRLQLNNKVKPQHKLNVANTIYFSTMMLFNISLAALYLALVDKNAKKTIKIPILFAVYSTLAYKLGVQWINRQFIRKIQTKQSQSAYFFRLKLIQQFPNNPLVQRRMPLLLKANKQYESIYNPPTDNVQII